MKRYYFNVYNADEIIINKLSAVANNLESAREKISFKLNHLYGKLNCFLRIDFNYCKDIK